MGNNPAATKRRRGRPEKFTRQQVAEAICHAKGMVESAARLLHCDADTVREYEARYPELKRLRLSEKEALKDLAELKLLQLIQQGDLGAICFFLKTQAKDRGYSERVEFTGRDGRDLPAPLFYLPRNGREVIDVTPQGALDGPGENGEARG